MTSEANDIDVSVHYAKLVKWENDPVTGEPRKDLPPLEIKEKFGDEAPFVTTFKRGD